MRAADVMTKNVVRIEPEASTTQACALMKRAHVSGLPVVDAYGKPIGIVTRSDLLRSHEPHRRGYATRLIQFVPGLGYLARQAGFRHDKKVGDVMTRKLIAATEETPLSDIVALLNGNRIKRVPVLHGDKMVGIVSRGDLIHALAWVFGAQEYQAILDADLKRRILAELDRGEPISPASLEITVHNGEVELRGTLLDKSLREAVRSSVANTPGVQAIHDHLDSAETASGEPQPSLKAQAARPA
ncbi:MAG: CBS domain-containing protein [Hyphomicrobiales bacterium]